MTVYDNIFYVLIVGIMIGIIISYSNLLSFILGISVGVCYKNRSLFDYVNDQINNLATIQPKK